MTSREVAKHSKNSAWEQAEDSVRALSDKILSIENKKEEKVEMKKLKKKIHYSNNDMKLYNKHSNKYNPYKQKYKKSIVVQMQQNNILKRLKYQ